ncbi:MAG: CopD family protein [Xanthobacteraceae bacterium]|uniref:CopD family protein n=1 Tax=Pseudolabrys sp. TaxID=1960880 RepID=UPI003D126D52
MHLLSLALGLHILSAVVWVGGMFAAYLCLRPAAGALEPPQRLALWRGFFQRFFPWVWVAVVLLLVSGYWMLVSTFGGFAKAPLYINLMQTIGLVMVALYAWLFHGPWLKFKRAVDAQQWPDAGAQLNRIRQIIAINLPLGLIVVAIGGTGRFWG